MLSVVPTPVTVRVPSKVNLHLAVGDLRPDGYHDLHTVFQALSLYDEVSVVPADTLSVTVRGTGAEVVPTDSTNLAWRAAEMMAERAARTPDVAITIDKGIPVAGGMAGGSADAAATLVALDALWGIGASREDLADLAARLGSDVPFCLHGGTAIGTGRGERLVPVLTRGTFHWVLALAKGGLSTPVVFRELDRLRAEGEPHRLGSADAVLSALGSGDAHQLAPLLGNDLQAAALSLDPMLRRTLRAGVEAGALAGIVSGSGPTCAFLVEDQHAAVTVSAELAGAGVCRTVRVASGPVPGARVVDDVDPAHP
ncbi:4-diphosphocytidyl-2C-methyl-D-erythritol kinase [Rhodococcus pyridinivorans KG-16]|uniref:4-diphosphocytidyl-2-C-methyl-D-erythritol kinase n=1 Tax=Rhodococcus pyridinivorans KG-16 TaxID=1441730 RepID=A0A0V9UKZ9_9NOCA|nr:4-(cytidine 5'-diphospho)-2-C-methyl-D-erythritol kinase [Rhodococcus pyridinivorans]KSZ58705.1 4-diphosphocytidyl-2C-methyl-D-erythritol kinase [Rhodococcus pyridinivorans KG-16]